MHEALTLGRLGEVLSYDPESGKFHWLKKLANRAPVGSIAGSYGAKGYRIIRIYNRVYYAHRLAWFATYGEWPPLSIDHIDGDRANNRVANLRLCTESQNAANSKRPSHNISGFKGVHWSTQKQKYRVRILYQGKEIHVGFFDEKEEGARKYLEKAKELFGEFARAS